jgi:hypothetical protein
VVAEPVMPRTTPAEHFKALYALYTGGATPGERDSAKRKVDAWLKRHGKTDADILSILQQAFADEAKRQPLQQPSDPRDAQKHPYEDPRFTPAGLVLAVTEKYLTMTRHVATIYALWICFTHVYRQFRIAPRIAMVSESPDSGKSTALDVAKCLVLRSNPEDYGSAAALADFIDEGPCTIGIDELDLHDPEALRTLQLMWNMGHKRGAKKSLVVGGKRKLVYLHAPMIAAGIGKFLILAQMTRTYVLDMERYTEATKPEREFDETDTADLDDVYRYLRHWATKTKLDLKPPMPQGMIARDADNARGMLAIAYACGPEWVRRLHEALTFFLEKKKAERPEIVFIKHGLVIFGALEIEAMPSRRFHSELLRLDLADAQWTQYRGASGLSKAHPMTPSERAALGEKVGIFVKKCKLPGGKQFRGYTYEQFKEAERIYCTSGGAAPRLRLITPTSE